MQRLSGADVSFVYGETPSWHMHAGTLVVLDPSTAPGGFDIHRLRALIEARIGLLGPFPIGPLLDGGGLNITVLSNLDHIDFGFVVCPEIVEEPWELADATSAAFAELENAVTRTASPPKRMSKATARGRLHAVGS